MDGYTIGRANGISAAEFKIEVLRLVEDIFIIDSTPSEDGSSVSYVSGSSSATNSDGFENTLLDIIDHVDDFTRSDLQGATILRSET